MKALIINNDHHNNNIIIIKDHGDKIHKKI